MWEGLVDRPLSIQETLVQEGDVLLPSQPARKLGRLHRVRSIELRSEGRGFRQRVGPGELGVKRLSR